MLAKDYDYLLIFEQGLRNLFVTATEALKIPDKKIIYALDLSSWLSHPSAIFSLVDSNNEGEKIYRHLNLSLDKQFSDFVTCTVEGISYIATAKDKVIMNQMYIDRKNFSAADMWAFHALTKKYYDVDDSSGWILDLGANIGTTGIYFTKKIAPNLKCLAFEPDKENFRMLKANILLNDLEDKFIVENIGLGAESGEQIMYKNSINPGGNSIIKYGENMSKEKINIITLDSYLASSEIFPEDVKYIWIDTEGFEAQVLIGMENLITKNPAPIFIEYNPVAWERCGVLLKVIALLDKYYSHFIMIKEFLQTGKIKVYPIAKLQNFKDPTTGLVGFGGLGDIFLIAKGRNIIEA